jgi:hypothetical protein
LGSHNFTILGCLVSSLQKLQIESINFSLLNPDNLAVDIRGEWEVLSHFDYNCAFIKTKCDVARVCYGTYRPHAFESVLKLSDLLVGSAVPDVNDIVLAGRNNNRNFWVE